MEFYLTFQGPVSTTGHAASKFKVRRSIHTQLKKLSEHYKDHDVPAAHSFGTEKMKRVEDFLFLPLVTTSCKKVIDLDITLLSHREPHCNKKYPTGDIDNLLKILLDGLRMAQNKNEIRSHSPNEGETPFYCLMEDDQYVNEVKIRHGKLLFPIHGVKKTKNFEVFALILVKIRPKFSFS